MYRHLLLVSTFFVTLTFSNTAKAASMDLWPASIRKNNTAYVIEGELSKLMFNIYPQNTIKGKYAIPDLEKDLSKKKISLVIDLPEDIKFIGASQMGERKFIEKDKIKTEPITLKGIPYIRYRFPLTTEKLKRRITRYTYYYQVWIKPTQKINSTIYWQLLEGDKTVLNASTRIKTIGKVEKVDLPKRFFFVPYHPARGIAPEINEEIADLYKRMGTTHINMIYYSKGWGDKVLLVNALKKAGIKIIAQRIASFGREGSLLHKHHQKMGLEPASKAFCNALASKTNKEEFAMIADQVDGVHWDAEYYVDSFFPGYDDLKTIKAFSLAKGFDKPLTPQQVKSKYKDEYRAYRMKLCTEPISVFYKMTRDIKPDTEVWICSGTGVGSTLDYETCNKYYDYLMPMIYTDPQSFYNRVKDTKTYHGGGSKLVPCISSGFTSVNEKQRVLTRRETGGLLLSYMGVASLGCAGICDWPGPTQLESGRLYEYYQGAKMLAPVEDFYFDGKPSKSISAKGKPYVNKKIKIGPRILDISQPKWNNFLTSQIDELKGDIAVTILNYHPDQEAFVEIKGELPGKDKIYLLNLFDGTYLSDGNDYLTPEQLKNGVIVKVNASFPAVWFLTDDPGRFKVQVGDSSPSKLNPLNWFRSNKNDMKKLRKIKMSDLINEFKTKQKAFIKK